MKSMMTTAAAAAVGMAVGAAAVCMAGSSHRQIRRSIREVARGAEKAMCELDRMIEKYTA